PLCSDFYPHGEVTERYGLLRQGPPFPGISDRAVIIVDTEGKVAWKKVYDLPTVPDVEEILAALREMGQKK
ncbi:MAG: alkyl hydroperoxide reductase, partial [Terriglobia bacterium]